MKKFWNFVRAVSIELSNSFKFPSQDDFLAAQAYSELANVTVCA